MLRAITSLLLPLALLIGSQRPAEAAPISIPGFSVQAPDGDGWRRVEGGNETVRYERKSGDELSMFEFTTTSMDESASDEAFLKESEAKLEAHFVERGLLSRHYNYTHSNGVACLAYDAIIRHKPGELALEFRKGWICRLPTDNARVAKLEAVRIAEARDESAEGAFLELADSVLRTVVFESPAN